MKIFIGSSKEALEQAEQIAVWIEECNYKPVIWNSTGLFVPGQYTFESLENISHQVDAAVFVFNEDDKTWYRNDAVATVRDNVLIEYGLFCGHLSRNNVCFYCKGYPKIASDLQGITYIDLNYPNRAKSELKNWLNTLILKKKGGNKSSLKIMGLLEAFQYVFSSSPSFESLKVFAISTFRSVQILRAGSKLKIKNATVLLREYESEDKFYSKSIENQIDLAIESWKKLRDQGVIKKLSIKRFNYHPDGGFYVFDNSFLLVGVLHFDLAGGSIEFDKEVMVIDNKTEEGLKTINLFTKKFNRILKNYE